MANMLTPLAMTIAVIAITLPGGHADAQGVDRIALQPIQIVALRTQQALTSDARGTPATLADELRIPQLASAAGSETVGVFKLAMGPVSAPLKIGGPPPAPGNTIVKCMPSEGPCPKPHHRSKRQRAGSAVQAR